MKLPGLKSYSCHATCFTLLPSVSQPTEVISVVLKPSFEKKGEIFAQICAQLTNHISRRAVVFAQS